MQTLFRLIFFGLFILGFIGAIASAHRTGDNDSPSPMASLIQDVRLAQEVNALNQNRWNHDVADLNEEALSKVQVMFQNEDAGQKIKLR